MWQGVIGEIQPMGGSIQDGSNQPAREQAQQELFLFCEAAFTELFLPALAVEWGTDDNLEDEGEKKGSSENIHGVPLTFIL